MKKKINIVLYVLAILSLMVGCTTSDDNEFENISLVIGANQNTYIHNFDNATKDLESVVTNGGKISFIRCDSTPTKVKDINIEKPNSSYSQKRIKKLKEEALNCIFDCANKIRPSKEQIDLISSIDIAAKNLTETDGNKTIIIFASGICTSGILDMSNSVIDNIDVEKTINALKNSDLPKLNDIDIKFYSLGNVGGSQYLSSGGKDKLRTLWESLLKKCSAKSIYISDLPSSDKLYEDVPKVNIVESKNVESIIATNSTSIDLKSDNIYKYDNFFFIRNKAVLKDEKDTINKLSNLAINLKNEPSIKIMLIGTTAKDGTNAECISLSKERAEVIAKLLSKEGIDQSRICTLGLGFDNCFHINEYDSEGNFIEEVAWKNRACYVTNSESDIVKELGLN